MGICESPYTDKFYDGNILSDSFSSKTHDKCHLKSYGARNIYNN